MKCINLCDIVDKLDFHEKNIEKLLQQPCAANTNRLFIGSYFCSQYFLRMNFISEIKKLIHEKHYTLTLVIPIVTEKDLSISKERIQHLLKELPIDEVTVNDIGMLCVLSSNTRIKINLGRLFFKDARDIRLSSYYHNTIHPALLDQLGNYVNHYDIKSAEFDPISAVMDLHHDTNIILALHEPFGYMTTGNICKFASIYKTIDQKFRPNTPCNGECRNIYESYTPSPPDYIFYRIGRAIYYETTMPKTLNGSFDRLIYTPFHEIAKIRKERSTS